jgi:hypothetical protein
LIDGMTLAEVGEIFAYWAENPPAHLILQAIARMLGWAPAPPAAEQAPFEAVAAAPPPGLAVLRRAEPGMPPPVLDPEPLRERNRALVLAAARHGAQ